MNRREAQEVAQVGGNESSVSPETETPQANNGTSTSTTVSSVDESTTSIIECPLVGFLPFTEFGQELNLFGLKKATSSSYPFTHMAAALLAVDHFNERNNAVVSNMADVTENCTVVLPDPVFSNTDSSVSDVAKFLVNQAFDNVKYCGIIGPFLNDPAQEAANFASGLDIPMVTHGSDDIRITSLFLNPRVATTTVDLHAEAEAVIYWFRSQGRTDFLATVAVTAEYGDQYQETMDNAARESGYQHVTHYSMAPPWDGFEPNRGIGYALEQVKKDGYRNIFVVVNSLFDVQLQLIADYAQAFGLNDGNYVWVISGNVDLTGVAMLATQNANVTKLIRGAAVIKPLDGFTYNPLMGQPDPLLQAWNIQNETFVNRVNALHPIRDINETGYFQASSDYFQTQSPGYGAGFMYDAVMTQALGRCKQQQTELILNTSNDATNVTNNRKQRRRVKGERRQPERRRILKKDNSLVRNAHLDGIFDTQFHGATGMIAFGEGTVISSGNRQRETLTYGAYNFRESSNSDADYTSWYYVTDILTEGTVAGQWSGTNDGPFVFASGQDSPPPLNRDLPDQNYLSAGVQITGLFLFAILASLIVGSTIIIHVNRTKPVIRQSQPIFLEILMLGCLTMTTAIITFSFDENDGWTDSQLDKACLAFPWLISLGYNCMYAALFSKLWRINQVLQFRRRKVEVRHVLGPFLSIVLANIVVLIVWTITFPFTWKRHEIDFDTGESYGRCNSEHSITFVSILAALMALSTSMCAIMAYKTKDVDSRFSESKWIFYTIFLQIQVLLLGIPILVILDTASADATYMGRVIVIFTVVLSVIILMIGPKFQQLYFPTRDVQQPLQGSTLTPNHAGASREERILSSIASFKSGAAGVTSTAQSKGKFGDGVSGLSASGLSTDDSISIFQSSVPKDISSSNDQDKQGGHVLSLDDQDKHEDALQLAS